MPTEETQPGCVIVGGDGLGTDETISIGVEPRSFVAAGMMLQSRRLTHLLVEILTAACEYLPITNCCVFFHTFLHFSAEMFTVIMPTGREWYSKVSSHSLLSKREVGDSFLTMRNQLS